MRLGRNDNLRFALVPSANSFVVVREDQTGHTVSVKFARSGNEISVLNDDGSIRFKATVTINNDRECRLLVNGQELEEWQFRKMALEPLFFS
jgi:16S rRNA U1498 N3-methylase RsmE